jgi:hypothetical protein
MKKTCLFLCICASLFILVSASIWEGATTTSGDLPDTGLYMATNSFPLNTVVEVTNLENGKTTRLIVYAGLDTAGFLAFLSRDAANALDIPDRSLGRIRMSQVSDLLALSRFTEGRVSRRDLDSLEFSMVPAEERPPVEGVTPNPSHFVPPLTRAPERPSTEVIDPALIITPIPYANSPPPVTTTSPAVNSPPPVTTTSPAANSPPPVTTTSPTVNSPPAATTPPAVARPPANASLSIFSVPTIRNLESGQYYLQVAAFSNVESVNPEISRIDNRLPVVVMEAGTPQTPLYRVLIGPLTLGEAGALLQRFRSTHGDAFVRFGE